MRVIGIVNGWRKLHMSKQMVLVFSIFVIVAVAACGSANQQGDQTQTTISSEYSHQESTTTSSANPPAPMALPPECDQGKKVTIVSQDEKVSVCQCAGDGLNVWWGAARNPNVAPDAQSQCAAGLHYAFQIHREQIIDLQMGLREALEKVSVVSSALPPPPVAKAPPPATVEPPAPKPVASAPAPVASVKETVTVDKSEMSIEYECAKGVVAKRILVYKTSKHQSSSREIQTCGGKTLACLTEHSAQQDFNTPPCVCGDKKTQPSQTLGTVWMCPDQ